jgi:hypothetical protein
MSVQAKKTEIVQVIGLKIKDTNKNWKVKMVRKVNGKNVQVGEVAIKSTDANFTFKNRTFPLKDLKALYTEKGTNYFLYDIEGSEIVDTKDNKIPIDVAELDNLITRNIVVGFFMKLHGAMDKVSVSGKVAIYIIVGVAGGAIGYIIRDQIVTTATTVLPMVTKLLGVA